jgi:hypothetical protein
MDQHWPEKQRWVIEKIGQERFDRIMLRASTPIKVDMDSVRFLLQNDYQKLLK